jgi:hypothetical protein
MRMPLQLANLTLALDVGTTLHGLKLPYHPGTALICPTPHQ